MDASTQTQTFLVITVPVPATEQHPNTATNSNTGSSRYPIPAIGTASNPPWAPPFVASVAPLEKIKQTRNTYAPQEVKRILARYYKSGMTARKFAVFEQIPRNSLSRWIKFGPPSTVKKATRTPMFAELGKEVYQWMLRQRDHGIHITNEEFSKKALELAQRDNITNFKASSGWVCRTKEVNDIEQGFRKPRGKGKAVKATKPRRKTPKRQTVSDGGQRD